MNKEKKKIKVSLLFAYAIFTFLFCFIFLATPFSGFVASAEDGISTQSSVDTNDVSTRYEKYDLDTVKNNIPDTLYYDSSLTNDGNSNILSDDWFGWSAGANVMNNDINKLVFTLNLNSTEYTNPVNTDLNSATRYYLLSFNLKKASKDTNTSEDILSVALFYNTIDKWSTLYIKQSKYSGETIGLAGVNCDSITTNDSFILDGYTPLYHIGWDSSTTPFNGDIEKKLYVVVDTSFLTEEYFISFEMYGCNMVNVGENLSKTLIKCADIKHSVDSKIVSSYDILNQMKERDEFSYLSEDMQEQAENVLTDGTIQKIQVSWLERVGETPFAVKKYDWVEVPVVTNRISPADVAVKLGVETFAVGQSSCQYFQEDTNTGIFNAYYLKNVWLSSKDANGHAMNLFLDINKSYKDYYYSFVQDGIFTRGMYEWFWSTMIVEYPEISGIDDENLYGYFGYTSVPYTYTLNQLVYELFDGSPNMDGICRYFSYRDNLTYSSYMKLLNDYEYGWLAKAWNTVAGFVAGSNYPADHYFFYVDGQQDNVFIGNNGGDDAYDNGSAIANGVKNVVEGIDEGLGIILDNPVTKWLFVGVGIFVLAWLLLKLFKTFFSVKKERQEYKNAKRRRKK